LARILASENAETLGPSENEVSTLLVSVGVGVGLASASFSCETCTVLTVGITATGFDSAVFVVSAIE
jgi:hypothetical protein